LCSKRQGPGGDTPDSSRELKLKLDLEKEFGVQFPSKKAGAQPAADNGQAARSGGLRAIK